MAFPNRLRNFIAVALLGLTLSACGYNTIPTAEETAKARWADVENNYQRRADLIPNLVATVQGYAKQEKDVLTGVIERGPRPPRSASTPPTSPIPTRSSSSRTRSPSLPARSAGCWRSAKTIRI